MSTETGSSLYLILVSLFLPCLDGTIDTKETVQGSRVGENLGALDKSLVKTAIQTRNCVLTQDLPTPGVPDIAWSLLDCTGPIQKQAYDPGSSYVGSFRTALIGPEELTEMTALLNTCIELYSTADIEILTLETERTSAPRQAPSKIDSWDWGTDVSSGI